MKLATRMSFVCLAGAATIVVAALSAQTNDAQPLLGAIQRNDTAEVS